MKLESSFTSLLKNVINLNESRYQTAKSGVDTVTSILKNDELFGDKFIDAKPQGSFRHETIIKPVDSGLDFDVDILFEMDAVDEWSPADYLNKLSSQLKKFDRYKDKIDTRGKTRCVTIDYESDFHIDIVPTIEIYGVSVVMNKTTNLYEPTDGDGYARWFLRKNLITSKKYLTKTIRLLKYVRDSKKSFDVKSVVLTTLLGNQVLDGDKSDELYPDVSTTFTRLITRLDTFLQSNPSVPTITNPVLPSENFNRHLDQAKYTKFRDSIRVLAEQALDAYKEEDETKSLKKWQKIFGDVFALPEKPIATERPRTVFGRRDPVEQFLSDFHISENLTHSVRIDARVVQDGFRPFFLRAASQLLRKQRKLEFIISSCTAPSPYSVKWKIKNTGDEAQRIDDLRGEILDDLGNQTRKENTKYEGSHYVECYIIKNGVCIAKDRIDVPIGRM